MRVMVLGEGKSGTTALFHSVAAAIGDPEKLFEPRILTPEDLAPDPLVVKKLLLNWRNRDDELKDRFDKLICITRDPRDRLISHLLYDAYNAASALDSSQREAWLAVLTAKASDPSGMSLTNLLFQWWEISERDLLSHHVRAMERTRKFFRRQFEGFFLLQYEDYVEGNFDAVNNYLGLELSTGVVDADLQRVARSGTHGDWRNWFTPEDLTVMRPITHLGLTLQGYDPNDWELAAESRIDSGTSVDYVRSLFDRVPISP